MKIQKIKHDNKCECSIIAPSGLSIATTAMHCGKYDQYKRYLGQGNIRIDKYLSKKGIHKADRHDKKIL